MAFGGSRVFGVALWVAWKKLQVFARTHLSHVLALSLAIWVLIREYSELKGSVQSYHFEWKAVLGLALLLSTICAVLWDLFGNRLSRSLQEARFVAAMQALLHELEKFMYGNDREPDPSRRLEQFTSDFLEITSRVLLGTKSVDASLLLPVDENTLQFFMVSRGAVFPKETVIPVSDYSDGGEDNAIGAAYKRLQIVYMPYKASKRWFSFTRKDGNYEPTKYGEGWVESSNAERERFRSVLCLPVSLYREKNQKRALGVLVYSTNSIDPFVSRDFAMAECFSSLLALAFESIRREVADARRNQATDRALPEEEK